MHDKCVKYMRHQPNHELAPNIGLEDNGMIDVDTPESSFPQALLTMMSFPTPYKTGYLPFSWD